MRHQKSNQATPFEAVHSMLSAVVSGFLFQITMMFLKSNQLMIMKSMDIKIAKRKKKGKIVLAKCAEEHKEKMTKLIQRFILQLHRENSSAL
jgi:hypothetical protein